jgi:general secretion pathway protein F
LRPGGSDSPGIGAAAILRGVATYEYIALTPSGDRITGQMSAANEQAVLSDLESKSLSAVRIAEKAERSGFRIRRGVDGRKLATAYQQFSDLLKAGVPMLRALRLLGRSKSNVRLAAAFAEMADLVEDGEDLSAAMRRHADLFPDVQVAMIQAGEAGGFLDQVLARLGSFLNHQADLRGKLLGSMIYPGVLMTLGAVVLGVIFGFFIPLFREFLDELPRLPLPTKVILFLSTMVTKHGLITLVLLVGAVIGAWRASKTEAAKRLISMAAVRMPILGPLARQVAVARFCRIQGTMLANGVPMLQSLKIAKDAAGNVLLAEAIVAATEAVRSGDSLAPPLEATGLFTDDVIEMIHVGESANNLDEVLINIADMIDGRVDQLLTTAVRLVEPLMLLFLGVVIAFIAVGLILPMMQLSGSI